MGEKKEAAAARMAAAVEKYGEGSDEADEALEEWMDTPAED